MIHCQMPDIEKPVARIVRGTAGIYPGRRTFSRR